MLPTVFSSLTSKRLAVYLYIIIARRISKAPINLSENIVCSKNNRPPANPVDYHNIGTMCHDGTVDDDVTRYYDVDASYDLDELST